MSVGSIYASCLTHLNITQLSLTTVYIVRRQTQVWAPVDVTREWEDPNGIVALNNALASVRVRRFDGTLIAFTVSAIVIAATTATATTALLDPVQTAHTVGVLLTNTTLEMLQQAQIDQEILTPLSAAESALDWIGKFQDTLVTCQQLTCDPGFSKLCVTLLQWNSSQHSWSDIQHHLRGAFSTNLKGQIDKLQLELHQPCLTKQEVFQTLCDNLGWLNPKNCYDGLNLRVWVFGLPVAY